MVTIGEILENQLCVEVVLLKCSSCNELHPQFNTIMKKSFVNEYPPLCASCNYKAYGENYPSLDYDYYSNQEGEQGYECIVCLDTLYYKDEVVFYLGDGEVTVDESNPDWTHCICTACYDDKHSEELTNEKSN